MSAASYVKNFLWKLAHANILLALSTAGAVYLVDLVLGLPLSPEPPLILFLVTFALYNFNRHTDRGEDKVNHPDRVKFINKYGKSLAILSLIAYVIAILLSFKGGSGAQFMVLVPLIAVILYSIKWLPNTGSSTKRLKEFFLVKNIVVCFVWALTVVYLPILYAGLNITMLSVALFGFFSLRIFINTAVFDMRDIAGDLHEGVNSIPVRLGYAGARHLMMVLNFMTLFFTALLPFMGLVPPVFYLFSISFLYGQIYLTLAADKAHIKYVCDVIVDSEFIIVSGLVLLLSSLLIPW